MSVVAIVNRKGGSGKSTLAAHLAGYCAREGIPVMLGDVDRQQSTQTWLRLREAHHPAQRTPIMGWTVDPRHALRVPPGVAHVILDTPGGLHGFELARVVMLADVVLMPVCNSVFDRESAADCHAELLKHPRVASGRCKVAAVGMRLDSRTKAAEVLRQWAQQRRLPFIGVLRETQAYVKCIEQGLTLFDMSGAAVEADMAQWQPILDWMAPVLQAAPRRSTSAPVVKPAACRAIERAVGEVPADEAFATAEVVTPEAEAAAAAVLAAAAARPARVARAALPEMLPSAARRAGPGEALLRSAGVAVPSKVSAPEPLDAAQTPLTPDAEPGLREAVSAAPQRRSRREPTGWVARWLARLLGGVPPRLLQRHR